MYDRRTFLRRAGLATAGAALLAGLPRPTPAADEALAPFFHGVASGDPLPDGVILWTRVTPWTPSSGVRVRWRVATDEALRHVVAAGVTTTDSDRDFTVKVDVRGLAPGRWYYYEFEALGRRSIVGRTKTAPAVGADIAVRFGVVSCSNYPVGYFNAYARLAERDVDAIVHLGDYLYEYKTPSGALRGVDPDKEIVALADYRRRHACYKLDPDLRRLHQMHPWVTTWDDHESTNNAYSGGAQNHQSDEGEWAERKAAAQRAYAEWMPVRVDDPAVIYRSLRYGSILDLIVLDTRLDGRDEQVGEVLATVVSGAEIDDEERKLISLTQRGWLQEELIRKGAKWKVVAQQVMFGQLNAGGLPKRPDLPDTPLLVFRDGGNAINPDQWDGYTAERNRVFRHVRDHGVQDLVVLTGDIHTSWAMDLTEDPYDPRCYNPVTGEGALGVEFVTPSVTSGNFAPLGPAVPALEAAVLADNPHMKYVDLDDHGYVVLTVDSEKAQADWYHVDTVRRRSDVERCAASWLVRSGEGYLERADGPAPAGTGGAAPPPALPRGAAADVAVGAHSSALRLPGGPVATGAAVVAGLGAQVIERRMRRADEQHQDEAKEQA